MHCSTYKYTPFSLFANVNGTLYIYFSVLSVGKLPSNPQNEIGYITNYKWHVRDLIRVLFSCGLENNKENGMDPCQQIPSNEEK